MYFYAQFRFKLDLSHRPITWSMGMYWRFVPLCSNPLREEPQYWKTLSKSPLQAQTSMPLVCHHSLKCKRDGDDLALIIHDNVCLRSSISHLNLVEFWLTLLVGRNTYVSDIVSIYPVVDFRPRKVWSK